MAKQSTLKVNKTHIAELIFAVKDNWQQVDATSWDRTMYCRYCDGWSSESFEKITHHKKCPVLIANFLHERMSINE